MDLSVQKMQPPASVQGKSAAKRTNSADTEDAVETATDNEKVRFNHGNTGYENQESDEQGTQEDDQLERQARRKQRQLLSGGDLSELTTTLSDLPADNQSADGLMNMRAYQTQNQKAEKDDEPHFEVNI